MAISIRLAQETERRLDYPVSRTGRATVCYLREIVEHGIEEMENHYLAADVLERVRKVQEQVHSLAEVRQDLGLEE